MSKIKYDYGVFIGRFAPVHGYISDNPATITGHVKVMVEALEQCDYLIVVVGSDNIARNTRTPFDASERIRMIQIATNWNDRILYTTVGDYPYNEPLWLADVQRSVNDVIANHFVHGKRPVFTNKGFKDYNHSIALAGMFKDQSSYYLNSFPQWNNSIAVSPGTYEGEILSATGIRNKLFNGELAYEKNIHPEIRDSLIRHMDYETCLYQNGEEYAKDWQRLQSDWKYEQQYESLWGKGPHVTVDACVIQAGHILLIQRGQEYGHGLWALPGGFLNKREKILNGCVRELKEETKLKVPERVLFGSVKAVRTYDDPYRSNRSHIITHCHKIVLENVSTGLPEVMGADDAEKAKWVPISSIDLMRGKFFEDHEQIILDMLAA